MTGLIVRKINALPYLKVMQSEELTFLRGKLECLEGSLQQAEKTKREAAKDISIRTKMITDMVMQLAVERERLQKQLSLLVMENRAHANKSHSVNKASSNPTNCKGEETEKEIPASTHGLDEKRKKEDSHVTQELKTPEKGLDSKCKLKSKNLNSKLETVGRIDAGRLNLKYVSVASLVLLIAVLAVRYLHPGNCPF